jgi:hypothetical protein
MYRQLRLYLDPFVPFKSIARETDALDYNRRHRGMLLPYVQRWAMIALACAGLMEPIGPLARTEPLLCMPILGLEICFSASVCVLLLALSVYVVLGLKD